MSGGKMPDACPLPAYIHTFFFLSPRERPPSPQIKERRTDPVIRSRQSIPLALFPITAFSSSGTGTAVSPGKTSPLLPDVVLVPPLHVHHRDACSVRPRKVDIPGCREDAGLGPDCELDDGHQDCFAEPDDAGTQQAGAFRAVRQL